MYNSSITSTIKLIPTPITMKLPQLFVLSFTISFSFFFQGTETKHFHLRLPHHFSTPSTTYQPARARARAPAPAPAPVVSSPVGYANGSSVVSPVPSSTIPTGSKFDVMSYGAVGDGSTDDTDAFKMAWDSCCQADESGIMLVPHGYSFLVRPTIFTGPCKRPLVFQIDGTIMAPDGPESWPRKVTKKQWLVFYNMNGMSMQGRGVIDGRGQKWWNLPCKPHKGINGTTPPGPCDSPVAIWFFMSSNLTVQGLEVKDSPLFHFRFDTCRAVLVEKLSINAPALSPNTDGIHIENTQNVIIHHSVVSTGDDCVSIGSGCSNVDIHNVTCGPSHGISIGSLGVGNSRACVSNVTVTNSVIRNSDNGVRIKTWQGGYGSVSKVTFDNIHMVNVRNPIIIDQYYCLTKNCTNQTSAVSISNIWYTNIKGTYDIRSPPVHFACSDSVPCTDLVLSEVQLLPAQGQKLADPFCWKAYGSMHSAIPPLFCLLDGSPRFMGQTTNDSC